LPELLACAGDPKAKNKAATMPARATPAATTVATIQPVDLVVGVVVVDMVVIFLSLRFGPSVPLTTTFRQPPRPRDPANGGRTG
jgi:hypothetical protein